MRLFGRILESYKILGSNRIRLSLDLDDDDITELRNLHDKRISVEIKEFKNSRSINANKYFHYLCGELAKKMTPPVTPAFMKNTLIARYGQHEMVGKDPMIYKSNAPIDYMMQLEDLHTYPAKGGDDQTTFFFVYRGSHTYDTAEMSKLIDGTVEECKAVGIQTKTGNEIFEMLERWGNAKKIKKRTN